MEQRTEPRRRDARAAGQGLAHWAARAVAVGVAGAFHALALGAQPVAQPGAAALPSGPAAVAATATGSTATAATADAARAAGPTPVVPPPPVDDRLAYAGTRARGVPRYVRRAFTDYERQLLRWAFGIENPNRLWLADSTTGATLRYDTRPVDGMVLVARVGYPSARYPGESWDEFFDRSGVVRPHWRARAFVTYAALDALAPDARVPFTQLLDDARRAGFQVRVRETFRTPERQAYLFAQGNERTATATSTHMVGRAIDVVVGDGQLGNPATAREWTAFRRWVLRQQGGRFRLIGSPERTWDWPHVELADDPNGVRSVSALLAAARRCAGHPDPGALPLSWNPRLDDGAGIVTLDVEGGRVPRVRGGGTVTCTNGQVVAADSR